MFPNASHIPYHPGGMAVTHFVIVSGYNGIYEVFPAKRIVQEFPGLLICFCEMQQILRVVVLGCA